MRSSHAAASIIGHGTCHRYSILRNEFSSNTMIAKMEMVMKTKVQKQQQHVAIRRFAGPRSTATKWQGSLRALSKVILSVGAMITPSFSGFRRASSIGRTVISIFNFAGLCTILEQQRVGKVTQHHTQLKQLCRHPGLSSSSFLRRFSLGSPLAQHRAQHDPVSSSSFPTRRAGAESNTIVRESVPNGALPLSLNSQASFSI